eukprot:754241-Hanusia_phi.AAC.2
MLAPPPSVSIPPCYHARSRRPCYRSLSPTSPPGGRLGGTAREAMCFSWGGVGTGGGDLRWVVVGEKKQQEAEI